MLLAFYHPFINVYLPNDWEENKKQGSFQIPDELFFEKQISAN